MRKAWLLLTVLIVVADYYSKQFAVDHLVLHKSIAFMPFFNFTLVYNSGAAFGFLSTIDPGWERWLLTGISIGASVFFLHWFWRAKHGLQSAAIALVLGGAIGNLIDRAFSGKVIDFMDFYVGDYHWPAFNLADAAICLGVGLLFLYWVKHDRSR